jgi:hypothetical protein
MRLLQNARSHPETSDDFPVSLGKINLDLRRPPTSTSAGKFLTGRQLLPQGNKLVKPAEAMSNNFNRPQIPITRKNRTTFSFYAFK